MVCLLKDIRDADSSTMFRRAQPGMVARVVIFDAPIIPRAGAWSKLTASRP